MITYQIRKFNNENQTVIVVGSGLAGLSAAISAIKTSDRIHVQVIEKQPNFGGNSAKATSGISGAGTSIQKNYNIIDDTELFEKDMMYSAYGPDYQNEKNELIEQLTQNGYKAIEFINDELKVDLQDVFQLGGHSRPRTHRIKKGPVGWTIVNAAKTYLEKNYPGRIQFLFNTEMLDFVKDQDQVVGVYIKNKENILQSLMGTVVLACGGYGNDHTQNSLLDKYVPQFKDLPTTNGPFTTGDGVKITHEKLGAKLVDMDQVQIHPTGFVDPSNPNDKTKFLAPEALRGSGGILINAQGARFTNELGLRKDIVADMFKNQGPFRIILNEEAKQKFGPNLDFYVSKGFFKKYENITQLAQELKLDASNNQLKESIDHLTKVYKEKQNNQIDKFGKKIDILFDQYQQVYSAIITPVIHYTMGGIAINTNAQVLDEKGYLIEGLFAAGEVTGGVHKKNRLAGTSLLDCAVYGKIAGESAAKHALQTNY